ncbi:MAG: hypoxanthine phosphoribosyltransferase [Clostridiales bacterium]|nr:hypoxanthine phosphoribosyltransferase [Clostridiales bacterium]
MAEKKTKAGNQIGKILFTQEEITRRAKEIAKQIDKDYEGEELILLGTLKGSVPWLVDILKYTTIDTSLDFISASSYGSSTTTAGVVKISYEPQTNMYNKNVLVVEDIVDTGTTLKYLMAKLEERGPKSVKVCTMLNKESRRTEDFHADYVGFEVEDLFVIGYGLDFDQRFRGLPYISYLEEDDVEML